jgi:hypothetical protein
MKKLFIGLLIVAAGAGVFYLLRKKKDTTEPENEIKKELIIGKWKTDAQPGNDSAFKDYRYEFSKDGIIVRSLNDSTKTDSSFYAWSKESNLEWKKNAADTTGVLYQVVQLTADSLQLMSKDSSVIQFIRLK